eukprot:6486653-Amphidinium_carterae.1
MHNSERETEYVTDHLKTYYHNAGSNCVKLVCQALITMHCVCYSLPQNFIWWGQQVGQSKAHPSLFAGEGN